VKEREKLPLSVFLRIYGEIQHMHAVISPPQRNLQKGVLS
jgi:hypothetical protein